MTDRSKLLSRGRALTAILLVGMACPCIAEEGTYGYASDLPVTEAVARFNRETRSALKGEPSGRTQPPLTEDELLAAVWARLVAFKPLPREVAATYRGIVKTRVLPRGSLLESAGGYRMARPGGSCEESPVDVRLWQIQLFIWLDRFPREPGVDSPAEPLLVRLQNISAAPAASKGVCEEFPKGTPGSEK